jgi:hypothetical protein
MQVHDRAQGAPVLARERFSDVKTHAKPCTLDMHGFFRKNSGIFGDLFSGLLCGQFCTTAGKNHVFAGEYFT